MVKKLLFFDFAGTSRFNDVVSYFDHFIVVIDMPLRKIIQIWFKSSNYFSISNL